MAARADNEVTVRIIKDGWTLETRGGRVTIQDLGDGTALVGDWECDGSDPHAALRLYRAGLKLVSAMKFKELLIHTDFGDWRLYDFYTKLGWEPTHIIYRKKQNGRNSKHNLESSQRRDKSSRVTDKHSRKDTQRKRDVR